MDKKVKRIYKLNKFLENMKISNEGYNSMDMSFLSKDFN